MTKASTSSSISNRLDENEKAGYEKIWDETQSSLSKARKDISRYPEQDLRVSRVAHLDASLLDNELESMLINPVIESLETLYLDRPNTTSFRWVPECKAAFKALILYLSLARYPSATYGQQLMNLRFRNEAVSNGIGGRGRDFGLTNMQKVLYIFGSVIGPYIHSRIVDLYMNTTQYNYNQSLIDEYQEQQHKTPSIRKRLLRWIYEHPRQLLRIQTVVEKVVPLLSLVNFLIFLHDGKYQSILTRLLQMRLVYADQYARRRVSFDFLNRQLVWEAFIEFVLFFAPLVNFRKFSMRLKRALKYIYSLNIVQYALPAALKKRERLVNKSNEKKGQLHFLPSSICPVCYQTQSKSAKDLLPSKDSEEMTEELGNFLANTRLNENTPIKPGQSMGVCVPYLANCSNKCRYCYYCIVSKLVSVKEIGDSSWECLRCGSGVTGATREPYEIEDSNGAVDDEKKSESIDGSSLGNSSNEKNELQPEYDDILEI